MTSLENSWQAITELGQQMQQLANDEEWSDIAALAIKRHQKVVKHFDKYPVSPEIAVFYQLHLNTFLQQEQQLKDVVEQARKKVIKGVVSINQGRRAINAYRNSAKPA
jgi:hypothetical protein